MMSPEQEAFLVNDAFVDEVNQRREDRKQEAQADAATKPRAWAVFLQSSSGTALITVLLGTIGGGVLTNLIQEHQKRNEAQALKIADYLKNQQGIYTDAFALLGRAVAASEDMATITRREFYTGPGDGLSKPDEAIVDKQKSGIVGEFNSVDAEWRRRRTPLSLLIRLYNRDDQGVARTWEETGGALTAFMDCEREFNERQNRLHIPSTPVQAKQACDAPQRQRLEQAEAALIQAVTAAQARAF